MPQDPEAAAERVHFGKYLLDQEIARGGMSRVFRARLRGPGGFEKKLVVKQILPELAADPSFVELFVKEANTLVQMSHPNLVPVYELGVIDDVYFLAMEWVEGATVAELLREGPLPESWVAQIGAQIAEALRYAHERFQIVHRDVTPRNVIIDGAGHARLLDFGIAAPVGHAGKGELFGSPGYMAPEQVQGDALGPESDIFSLGCVLYEAISGTPAYPVTRSGTSFLTSQLDPQPLAADEGGLSALIARLLARDRSQRPASAGEVSDALRTWLAQRHPRGVDAELAERAMRVHAQREAEPHEPGELPAISSSGRIEVRSLALSPVLSELLQHATERMARPTPTPVPETLPDNIADDPELHRLTRRFLRDAAVIMLALVAGVYYAQRATREQYEPAAPPSSSARAVASAKTPASPQPTAASPQPAPRAAAPEPQAAHTAEAAQSVEGAKKSGFLTVSASPWAEVRVDGHALGVTPRRNLPLRAGKHTLTLTCPPLDREAKLAIELQPGQSLRVVADLHEDPAKLSVQ
jgi:eukaryotic-like serine/threonine-protein kinase